MKKPRWIAAGTHDGDVFVWDTETSEQVFTHKDVHLIIAVDFSPNPTRLLVGQNYHHTGPSICDVPTPKSLNTRKRYDGSEVLAARRSNRESHL